MQSRQALDAPHKYTLQAFNMVYGVHCWHVLDGLGHRCV